MRYEPLRERLRALLATPRGGEGEAQFRHAFSDGSYRASWLHAITHIEMDFNMADRLSLMRRLLDLGVDVDARDHEKDTPLHDACDQPFAAEDQRAVVHELLSRGANPNATNTRGQTPLWNCENEDVVKLLVNHGARVNVIDKAGHSLLFCACLRLRPPLVATLIENGCRVDLKSKYHVCDYTEKLEGSTTFFLTERSLASRVTPPIDDVLAILEVLLKAPGASVDDRNSQSFSLLMYCVEHDKFDPIAQYLLDKGADVRARDDAGGSALHWLFQSTRRIALPEQIVKRIVSEGGDLALAMGSCVEDMNEWQNLPSWLTELMAAAPPSPPGGGDDAADGGDAAAVAAASPIVTEHAEHRAPSDAWASPKLRKMLRDFDQLPRDHGVGWVRGNYHTEARRVLPGLGITTVAKALAFDPKRIDASDGRGRKRKLVSDLQKLIRERQDEDITDDAGGVAVVRAASPAPRPRKKRRDPLASHLTPPAQHAPAESAESGASSRRVRASAASAVATVANAASDPRARAEILNEILNAGAMGAAAGARSMSEGVCLADLASLNWQSQSVSVAMRERRLGGAECFSICVPGGRLERLRARLERVWDKHGVPRDVIDDICRGPVMTQSRNHPTYEKIRQQVLDLFASPHANDFAKVRVCQVPHDDPRIALRGQSKAIAREELPQYTVWHGCLPAACCAYAHTQLLVSHRYSARTQGRSCLMKPSFMPRRA